jgi:hypothetical protein
MSLYADNDKNGMGVGRQSEWIVSGTCGLGFAITVQPMVQDHRCTIIQEWSS